MRKSKGRLCGIAIGLLLASRCWADLPPSLEKLRPLFGPLDAAMVVTAQGRELLAVHADTPLVPASTLKLLTALVALEHLGADYRFPTEFWLDRERNLIIRGYGDPLLVSEAVEGIGRELAVHLQQRAVNDIVLDDGFFLQPLMIPGVGQSLEPYDAGNGALCVNFNTVAFHHRGRSIVSSEPQTPLLPVVIPHLQRSGLTEGRITLPGSREAALLYAGELFHHFLKVAGVTCRGKLRQGRVDPQHDNLLYRHLAEAPLSGVIERLLAHSNNFIANQVFLAAGAAAYGPPASLASGVRSARCYAADRLALTDLVLVEGSGISRNNRISARGLLRVLQAFAPNRHLMRREENEHYKTGTLSGIQTRVGYIEAQADAMIIYALLVNTPGRRIEPIMAALRAALSPKTRPRQRHR